MSGFQYPYQNSINNQFNQFQQIQQMFPQPQGSVYSISSPLDIGNVPIGSTGLSVALCLNEGVMYIKSFQNGSPVIMSYRISPHTRDNEKTPQNAAAEPATVQTSSEVAEKLDSLDQLNERIAKLETAISKLNIGGKYDELL